jgi:hypothetical protein
MKLYSFVYANQDFKDGSNTYISKLECRFPDETHIRTETCKSFQFFAALSDQIMALISARAT